MRNKFLKKKFVVVLVLMVIIPTTYAILKDSVLGNELVTSASWNVALNQTDQNNNLSVVPDPNGTTASYTVNVRSDSEVDVTYSIVISNLPSGTSVSLDGGNYVQESNNEVIFSNIGNIPYTDSIRTRSHVVRFKAGSAASVVNNQEVNVNVVMKQSLE